jgi:hypothetical protein
MTRGTKTSDLNAGDPGIGKRRRTCRAPVPVILRLRADLEANEHHPLAGLDPVVRDAERQRLMASILARLANGPIRTTQSAVTMVDESAQATSTDDSSKAE